MAPLLSKRCKVERSVTSCLTYEWRWQVGTRASVYAWNEETENEQIGTLIKPERAATEWIRKTEINLICYVYQMVYKNIKDCVYILSFTIFTMKFTLSPLLLLLTIICTSARAMPMEQPPKDFQFDNSGSGDFPDPFMQPQLLPYNTSDCKFPHYDMDPELRMLQTCLIECALDPNCQTLGFNRTQISCACPAQVSIHILPSCKF